MLTAALRSPHTVQAFLRALPRSDAGPARAALRKLGHCLLLDDTALDASVSTRAVAGAMRRAATRHRRSATPLPGSLLRLLEPISDEVLPHAFCWSLAACTMLRAASCASLRPHMIATLPDHSLRILLPSSKTRDGCSVIHIPHHAHPCAPTVLWRRLCRMYTPAAMQDWWPATPRAWSRLVLGVVRRASAVAPVLCSLPPTRHGISVHSLRRGGAHTLFRLGATAEEIRRAGDWAAGSERRYLPQERVPSQPLGRPIDMVVDILRLQDSHSEILSELDASFILDAAASGQPWAHNMLGVRM